MNPLVWKVVLEYNAWFWFSADLTLCRTSIPSKDLTTFHIGRKGEMQAIRFFLLNELEVVVLLSWIWAHWMEATRKSIWCLLLNLWGVSNSSGWKQKLTLWLGGTGIRLFGFLDLCLLTLDVWKTDVSVESCHCRLPLYCLARRHFPQCNNTH